MDWFWSLFPFLGLAGYSLWESFQVRLVQQTVTTTHSLTPNELRIAHLSDLHMTRLGMRERKAIALVEQFRPDFIALTGDLTPLGKGMEAAETFLKTLCDIAPVFAVEGNSEVVNGFSQRFAQTLQRMGGHWLHNEAIPFNDTVWVAGTADPHWHRDDAERALKQVPVNAFCVLLSHSPDIVTVPAALRADLILCGHTHGGQIRLPLFGALYIRARRIPKALAWGRHRVGDRTELITTSGIGTTRLPFRLLCPPEVVGITVQRLSR